MARKRHQETPLVNHLCFCGDGVSTSKGSAVKANQAGTKELLERKAELKHNRIRRVFRVITAPILSRRRRLRRSRVKERICRVRDPKVLHICSQFRRNGARRNYPEVSSANRAQRNRIIEKNLRSLRVCLPHNDCVLVRWPWSDSTPPARNMFIH